tara:strand:- start:1694 stop:1888 length:195 start_codon:yes stop_codon:yes gene_type:complete
MRSKKKNKKVTPQEKAQLDQFLMERAQDSLMSIAKSYERKHLSKQAKKVRCFIKEELKPFMGNL